MITVQRSQEGPPLPTLHKSMFMTIIKNLQTRKPPKPDSSIKSYLYTLFSTSPKVIQPETSPLVLECPALNDPTVQSREQIRNSDALVLPTDPDPETHNEHQ